MAYHVPTVVPVLLTHIRLAKIDEAILKDSEDGKRFSH